MSDEEYEIYARFVRSYQEDSDAEEEEEVEEDENHDHDEEDDSDEDYNPEDENAENDETDTEEETDYELETDDERAVECRWRVVGAGRGRHVVAVTNNEETDDIDDDNIRDAIINGWVVCRQRS